MEVDNCQEKWHHVQSKKQVHGSILTLDNLNKSNWKHSILISELQAQYKANKKTLDKNFKQVSEDSSR